MVLCRCIGCDGSGTVEKDILYVCRYYYSHSWSSDSLCFICLIFPHASSSLRTVLSLSYSLTVQVSRWGPTLFAKKGQVSIRVLIAASPQGPPLQRCNAAQLMLLYYLSHSAPPTHLLSHPLTLSPCAAAEYIKHII